MEKKKIVYYNIAGNLDYEKSLLEEWKIDGLELVEVKDPEEKNFISAVLEAQGLVVEYEEITKEVLSHAPKLKCIALQSIGYNNIDTKAAEQAGVYVTNAPGYCAPEVAEHTIGLMLALDRKIPFFDRQVRKGHWNPTEGYPLYRIAGKTVGLVFFGEIPKRMVPVLKAFEMKILVYAPTKSGEYLSSFGCKKVELEELLHESDFVSLHCPLIKGVTEHLIGEAELKKMKPTSFLINTARGAIVDEKALVKALRQGWIRGAGIDVLEREQSAESDLTDMEERVVITPHAAYISEDALHEGRRIALEQLVSCIIMEERPKNAVNEIKL